MRPLSAFQKLLAWIFGLGISLLLFLSIIQSSSPSLVTDQGYSFFTLLSSTLIQRPLFSFSNFSQDMASFWRLQDENDAYRKEFELIGLYQAKLEEAYREIEALKALNDLAITYSEYQLINTSIVGRSLDVYSHVLEIDVGSNDGVEINDAVISSKGLVGKILTVQEDRSSVLLLSTENSMNKVAVKIQLDPTKTAEAILEKYEPNEGVYLLKLIDTQSSINAGMRVVSSGLGGYFPSGLLIGEILEVETLPDAIGLKIKVKPAVDFYRLDYLAVVKHG